MSSEANAVWNECLRIIEQHVNEQSFSTWFKPINPVRIDGSVLTIQVPSQFFYEWLEDKYVQVLKLAIKTVLGAGGKLAYAAVVDRGNAQNQPCVVSLPQASTNSAYTKADPKAETARTRSPVDLPSLNSDALPQSRL